MPRGEDWEDEDVDRPRRRRQRARYEDDDDEDDYDIRRRGAGGKSGAVTGVGIISIILGSLDLLFGVCMLLVTIIMGNEGNRGAFAMPGFGGAVAVVLVFTLLILLWGTLTLVSGIGVLNRRQWARVMVLVLSGIGAAVGLLYLFLAFGSLSAGVDAAGNRGANVMGFLFFLLLAAILIGYCVWSYVVLLNARYGSEFR